MDVERAQRVVRHLLEQPGGRVVTPMGNHITPRWVLTGRLGLVYNLQLVITPMAGHITPLWAVTRP